MTRVRAGKGRLAPGTWGVCAPASFAVCVVVDKAKRRVEVHVGGAHAIYLTPEQAVYVRRALNSTRVHRAIVSLVAPEHGAEEGA